MRRYNVQPPRKLNLNVPYDPWLGPPQSTAGGLGGLSQPSKMNTQALREAVNDTIISKTAPVTEAVTAPEAVAEEQQANSFKPQTIPIQPQVTDCQQNGDSVSVTGIAGGSIVTMIGEYFNTVTNLQFAFGDGGTLIVCKSHTFMMHSRA
jgi:hypothetical protein